MSIEPMSTGHDLNSFTPAFVPPAVAAIDPAIEASVADIKRRLQIDKFASDDPVSSPSPDAVQLAIDSASADATGASPPPDDSDSQRITDVTPAGDSPGAGDLSAAGRLPAVEPFSDDWALGDELDVHRDREVVADGDVSDDIDSPADVLHPYWIPPGLKLSDWSPELLADVAALINPLYREYVLLAPSPLTRSIGSTLVFLGWLEIIDQLEMGASSLENDTTRLQHLVAGDPRPALIERYLRIVGAKLRISQFMLRLQEIKSRHEQPSARPTCENRDRSPHGEPGNRKSWPLHPTTLEKLNSVGQMRTRSLQEIAAERGLPF